MKQANYFEGDVVALVRELYAAEDDALSGARERADAAGLPMIEIAPEDGALLQLLVRLVAPRVVVEVGTLFGYSAIWMARALTPGAELFTAEADEHHATVARANVEAAGLADRVTIVTGRAPESLTGLPDPVDMVFVDADKTGYPSYLEWARRRLRPGGLFLADNAFQKGAVADPHGDAAVAVRGMLDMLATDAAWSAAMLPTLEGMAIAIRTDAG